MAGARPVDDLIEWRRCFAAAHESGHGRFCCRSRRLLCERTASICWHVFLLCRFWRAV